MNRDELLAAADTVVQAAHDYPGDEWLSQKVVTAADELAGHIQRLYDPTPVDEAWMLSVGGTLVGAFPSLSVYLGNRIEWWVSYEKTLWLGDQEICDNPTRGDVRRLCDAFGIELREEP